MGFWSFLKRKPAAEGLPETEPPAKSMRPPSEPPPWSDGGASPDLAKLLRVGLASGPSDDDALWLFRQLRSSPEEGRMVESLARVAQQRPLPEALLVSLGGALIDRGEDAAAAKALVHASSSAALVMQADLAERRSDLATAISLIERVMLREIDHPGARERHRRWRGQLGFDVEHKPLVVGATVVTREPDAPFDLLREVGRGGAGAVYEAVDRELGRHVALKVYHQPERDREQLAHEARVAVALEGPAIVRVFDVDPDHGWIALEWAPLATVREQIRARNHERLLPFERWVRTLVEGLARVHQRGWVHHDVKPANVLLGATGAAILADFGTARRIGEPSPPGSLGYLSPERMRGRPSDPRDDVYGFGRVLEDVLDAVPPAPHLAKWRHLAVSCTGPDAQRPADARALAIRIRVEV